MLTAWKGLSPEELRGVKAKYRLEHPEDPIRRKQTARSYYLKNQEALKEKAKTWVTENPEKLFRAQLLRLYGITLEEWTALLVDQSGLCALCGVQMDGPKEPFVDHDHYTGKVRGLLCRNCNTGLGMFEDCVDLLELAIVYLQKHDTDESS